MGVADAEYYALLDQMVRYGTDCPKTGYQDNNGSPVPNAPYEHLLSKSPKFGGFRGLQENQTLVATNQP
ncbi:MAG: hypothetical protein F6K55_03545 [Moorea sp. SIO4A3]|nr:hypothetical protein [Moorena sp. SIO4A3]